MYSKLKSSLDRQNVKLLVVSKRRANAQIMELYNQGHRFFGENRAAEFVSKAEELPRDIEWHFIGPLQSNKISSVVPHASMIHSGSRMKVFRYVDKYAAEEGKIMDILLQIHIAEEEGKHGFKKSEVLSLLDDKEFGKFKNIRIRGMMGMATLTEDVEKIRREFSGLLELYNGVQEKYFPAESFNILSMGMSNDYKIAVEEGANIVRVGSLIFNE